MERRSLTDWTKLAANEEARLQQEYISMRGGLVLQDRIQAAMHLPGQDLVWALPARLLRGVTQLHGHAVVRTLAERPMLALPFDLLGPL